MKRSVCQGLIGAFAALFLLGSASAAGATTIYSLTGDHCTGGCGVPPFGTVSLTQSGTTVDVTVHLNSGFAYAKTGAADDQAFKFNATGVSLADITVNAHAPTLTADAGAFNGDGTGTFGFGIICGGCGGGASDTFTSDITFHVANASIADLTHPNSLGNVFVADIWSQATGNTGPVFATTCLSGCAEINQLGAVPEPTSIVLLGSALLLAGRRLRHFKR